MKFMLNDCITDPNQVEGLKLNAGGMLGTWFRYKYPHVIDGVIAGSAPIWNFDGEVSKPVTSWSLLGRLNPGNGREALTHWNRV
jgi:hypothetical protein